MRSRTERIGFLAVKLWAGMTPQGVSLVLSFALERKDPAGRAAKNMEERQRRLSLLPKKKAAPKDGLLQFQQEKNYFFSKTLPTLASASFKISSSSAYENRMHLSSPKADPGTNATPTSSRIFVHMAAESGASSV
ncbi:hypothetical protein EDC59_11480 [Pseudodesulfovibrio indicus]|uniref:Uncharacterized protein n=1 Tax=Pseudodesulfovibrio indicus TaxID=1716143 RepID=A0AA94PTQ2_9BACT|nr:hypothetical protein EDC59_11480 [Pseudodesulfovibrio indicus]